MQSSSSSCIATLHNESGPSLVPFRTNSAIIKRKLDLGHPQYERLCRPTGWPRTESDPIKGKRFRRRQPRQESVGGMCRLCAWNHHISKKVGQMSRASRESPCNRPLMPLPADKCTPETCAFDEFCIKKNHCQQPEIGYKQPADGQDCAGPGLPVPYLSGFCGMV